MTDEEYKEFINKRINEIYETDVVKNLDLEFVSKDFEKVNSINELRKNEFFKDLFEYIWLDVDPLNRDLGEDFIKNYARDVFLVSKWNDYLDKTNNSKKNLHLNNIIQLLLDLYTYTGSNLSCDFHPDSIVEVIEMRIIKSLLPPNVIGQIRDSLEEFHNFLEKENISHSLVLLDTEEIEDLKRVAKEFKEGEWEKRGEEYPDWRERNINFYM